MKKILFLITILLVAGDVSAQTYFNGARADYNPNYQSNWSFEAAANLSNVTSGANFTTHNLPGFSAGLNVDLPVTQTFSVMPVFLYALKGFKATTPAGGYTQRTQAVEIPILAKFQIGKVFTYLGPQVSYLTSAKNKYDDNFTAALREKYEYGGVNLRYQAVYGLGADVTKSVSIHTRYSLDLTATPANGNVYVPTYRGHAFQLGFGVHI